MISTDEGLFPCKWHEHTTAWLANPDDAKLMTLNYEALKEDTLAELRRLCDFAEGERDRQVLKNVARTCAFDAMREKEKRMGWADSIWPKDKSPPRLRRIVEGRNASGRDGGIHERGGADPNPRPGAHVGHSPSSTRGGRSLSSNLLTERRHRRLVA